MAVKAAGNVTFSLAGTDITDNLSEAQLNAAVAELNTSNLGSGDEEYEPGQRSWDGTFTVVNWTKAIDTILYNATTTKATAVLTATDSGSNTVTYTWTSEAFVTGYSVGGAVGDLVQTSPTIRFSGAPARIGIPAWRRFGSTVRPRGLTTTGWSTAPVGRGARLAGWMRPGTRRQSSPSSRPRSCAATSSRPMGACSSPVTT